MAHKDRPLLSCYFPLGDPRVPVELLDIYAGEGVDVIEIGMASPEPFLDGTDVRASMQRADRAYWRRDLQALLERLARFRAAPHTLLMTYVDEEHPAFSDHGLWQGLDSLLVVAREGDALAAELEKAAAAAGVSVSAFLPLPLTDAGIARAQKAGFYVMLQSNDGPTGPRKDVDPGNAKRIASLREAGIRAPILLGFGISNGMQAQEARDLGASGVVVGSQVLRAALSGADHLKTLLHDLRSGLDA
jgi:tryptophan synthase alpha chain